MNKLQRIVYRLHMFYLFPAFWREVFKTSKLRKTWHFWCIEEETTRGVL